MFLRFACLMVARPDGVLSDSVVARFTVSLADAPLDGLAVGGEPLFP